MNRTVFTTLSVRVSRICCDEYLNSILGDEYLNSILLEILYLSAFHFPVPLCVGAISNDQM